MQWFWIVEVVRRHPSPSRTWSPAEGWWRSTESQWSSPRQSPCGGKCLTLSYCWRTPRLSTSRSAFLTTSTSASESRAEVELHRLTVPFFVPIFIWNFRSCWAVRQAIARGVVACNVKPVRFHVSLFETTRNVTIICGMIFFILSQLFSRRRGWHIRRFAKNMIWPTLLRKIFQRSDRMIFFDFRLFWWSFQFCQGMYQTWFPILNFYLDLPES